MTFLLVKTKTSLFNRKWPPWISNMLFWGEPQKPSIFFHWLLKWFLSNHFPIREDLVKLIELIANHLFQMDRHQLVAWYRKSRTDPQLKDLKQLVLARKAKPTRKFGWNVRNYVMLFSQWLGCLSLPSVFFSQQFLICCFLGPSELCLLSRFVRFSTRFSQQEKESIEKMAGLSGVGAPVFGSPKQPPKIPMGFFDGFWRDFVITKSAFTWCGLEGRDASLARSTSESQWKVGDGGIGLKLYPVKNI